MSSVRQLMHSTRAERRGLLRIGGADTRMSGHWPALAASTAFVFACFFLIGHATRTAGRDATRTEAPATLQAATGTAEIPSALNSAPPIESWAPIAIAETAHKRGHQQPEAQPISTISIRSSLAAPAPVQPLTGAVTQRVLPVAKPQTSSTAAPLQVSRTAPTPAAVPAPTRSSSGGRGGSGRGGASGAGAHSSGGGGSFDSSE